MNTLSPRNMLIALAMLGLSACANVPETLPNDPNALNTVEYPEFRPNPARATAQIGEGERLARIDDLERTGVRAQATPVPMSEVERLRRIRALHEAQTIAEIEAR